MWVLLSTHAPGCYAVWLAAQWSPLGGCVALAHTAAPAAISYCESLLGPRSLDTPGETHGQKYTNTDSNEHFITLIYRVKKCIFILQYHMLLIILNNIQATKSLTVCITNATVFSNNCSHPTIQSHHEHFEKIETSFAADNKKDKRIKDICVNHCNQHYSSLRFPTIINMLIIV